MNPAAWGLLIDGLIEAVWLVDPVSLRILAVNHAAADLLGLKAEDLVGKPAIELTVTPEDQFFWEDIAAGLVDGIHSETLLRGADGMAVPVERRVSRVWPETGRAVYVVGIRDLRQQRRTEDELESLVAELRATLESTADGILVTDRSGDIRNYNRHFAAMWDVPEELLLNPNDRALHGHLASRVLDAAAYETRLRAIAESPLLETTDVLILITGRLLERVSRPQFSRGQATGRVFSFRDITQSVDAQSRLRLAAKVFESSVDAIFITDPDLTILAVNPVCERLTDTSQAQLLGESAKSLFQDPCDPELMVRVEQVLRDEGFWRGQVWLDRAGRSACAVHLSWVLLRDEDGAVLHTICFFKDLTEELAAQKRIEQLAYSDALTGLPNKLLLSQRVGFALRMAERHGSQFGVFFLDLDHFKNINDSMGHVFGDRVLVEVAERIKRCLRDADTLCRLGGDDFVIFVQEIDARGAEMLAQRILDLMAQAFLIEETSFSVGCSIGIALYPADGRSLDELIKCADTAMYLVKERGRGSFRFYQPQMNVDLLSRMKMDHAMRRAMEQGMFRLHYQPQISLANGQLVGVEALIRWLDGELGNVSPVLFIPLAEESGFIITIGTWVLKEAVRQAVLWQNAGTPVTVSVNVSALQFQQTDFVEIVANVLKDSGLAPYLLELELTETILVRDANETLNRLHALAALGVALSIDDFGTGYSSLAYLKKFPISKLKIDRSFVMGLPDDEGDRAIVSATIGMARGLKLKVVAEGVETIAQRDYLAGLNCESFQGFLCSPGLPAEEFERLMASFPRD
ncbi:diguanylate cyclase/phosphodiesterase with PAS/PAC sensor(s) [Rhodoferax ferrireducens T118]|uniref:Diguanylate cyclase/phosphodiesterase with PAS/PAC sensor(S) n=1 Tax=Albidiferax ferrireducens (strain ATCC BAA-621 / DSM 15236 / T118) TaxID=338969 RepID=Q21V58_ALBFT|nr:EAL domain-containing protein [Rhodoferax ferrireducens]ABD70345.1 diguanylate cyclase/phosphodiesterase with PAS/PAC sensor(s) [Rhodoferax ferrireducens T118]